MYRLDLTFIHTYQHSADHRPSPDAAPAPRAHDLPLRFGKSTRLKPPGSPSERDASVTDNNYGYASKYWAA
jgi:hypothetical protein